MERMPAPVWLQGDGVCEGSGSERGSRQLEILISELGAVNRLPAGAIATLRAAVTRCREGYRGGYREVSA
jgi:hypothetical protein